MRLGWLRQELDDLDPQRRLLDAVEDVATYVHMGKKSYRHRNWPNAWGLARSGNVPRLVIYLVVNAVVCNLLGY